MPRPSRSGATVKLPFSFFKNLQKNTDITSSVFLTKELNALIKKHDRSYDKSDKAIPFDITVFSIDFLKAVQKDLNKSSDKMFRKASKELDFWFSFRENPTGVEIKNLEYLKSAIIRYVITSKNLYLFQKNHGYYLPYLVTDVTYHPPYSDGRGYTHPAYVELVMQYCELGESHSKKVNFYYGDIIGEKSVKLKVKEVLENSGLFLENEMMMFEYEASMVQFDKFHHAIGKQFLAVGTGFQRSGWSSYDNVRSMLIDGTPSKVVVDEWGKDPDSNSGKKLQYTAVTALSYLELYRLDSSKLKELKNEKNKSSSYFDDDDDEFASLDGIVERIDLSNISDEMKQQLLLEIPYHPYLRTFSLEDHSFYDIHINDMVEYKYDTTLIDKLILPEDHKDLVEILIDASTSKMKDIIAGKSTGIIVIGTGPAGVGKTLTAEVFSEFVERPLYKVQSSQLGADIKDLESTLKTVLRRAYRWNAILLIDEADVYVYERGDNLLQNAIVGVFLRVLEYYKGILFMTSNRDTIIDDAILSRATAHIKYDYPVPEDLAKIWKVQNDLLKANLDENVIEELIRKLPKISGRDVRNILRLAKIIAQKKKKKISVEMIMQASKYQDLTYMEDDRRESYRKEKKGVN